MSTEPTKLETTHVQYEACPLCESTDFRPVGEVSCIQHPLYRPELPPVLRWSGCAQCGHVFTEGYFSEEIRESVFQRTHRALTPGQEIENTRPQAAEIVANVSRLRGSHSGRWLEVALGNGSMLTTAEEFGYQATGLDSREAWVQYFEGLGYDTRHGTPEDLGTHAGIAEEAPFDVISLVDCLERSPFPRSILESARERLAEDGMLFLSVPNSDCFVWRMLDQRGQNPYWMELENHHQFGRERLYALLRTCGFEPYHYGVSRDRRASMDIVAIRSDPA